MHMTYTIELKKDRCRRCGRDARFRRTVAMVPDRGATRARRMFAWLYNATAGRWRRLDAWSLEGCTCAPRLRPAAPPEDDPPRRQAPREPANLEEFLGTDTHFHRPRWG